MRCWSIRPRNEGRILPASNGHLLDCHLSRLSLGCTGSMGNLHSSLFAFGLNYQDASGTLRKQVCCLYRHIQISMSIFAGCLRWGRKIERGHREPTIWLSIIWSRILKSGELIFQVSILFNIWLPIEQSHGYTRCDTERAGRKPVRRMEAKAFNVLSWNVTGYTVCGKLFRCSPLHFPWTRILGHWHVTLDPNLCHLSILFRLIET